MDEKELRNVEQKVLKVASDNAGVVEMRASFDIGGYAEMFETLDGQPIDCGYFVTLNGRKVRIANPRDRYILGVYHCYTYSARWGQGCEMEK